MTAAKTKAVTKDPLPIHIKEEYMDLIQPLTAEEYEQLRDSIAEKGQHYPIIVSSQGVIIDGHHRFRACTELQIPCKYKTITFTNKTQEQLCIIDCNLKRRHLTDAQKIEIGHKIKPIYEQLAKDNQSAGGKGVSPDTPLGRVDDVVAKEIGLLTSTFQRGEKILSEHPELFEKLVKKGNQPIGKVHQQLKKEQAREEFKETVRNSEIKVPNGCKLILGDFIEKSKEIVEDNSIDLIFTDPPYDEESLPTYEQLAILAARVIKPGGSIITYLPTAFLDIITDYMKAAGLTDWWTIVVKLQGGFAKHYQRQVIIQYKPLLWFVKGDKLNSLAFIEDCILSKKPKKIAEDWKQSPIEARHCISKLTAPNSVVFDPMMGSGTTGVAALQLERQFIGIEILEDRLNKARYLTSHLEKEDPIDDHESEPEEKKLEILSKDNAALKKAVEEYQRQPNNDALYNQIDLLKKENTELKRELKEELEKHIKENEELIEVHKEQKGWLLDK